MLHLAPGLDVPVELTTEADAILGRRGSGKTNTAVIMVEEMLDAGQQVVVVDTVGVWWGLRSLADGSPSEYDVVVFGGLHGDVPLEEGGGKIVANAILDHGLSAVVDTSLFSKAAARRFLLDLITELYHRKGSERSPLHVVFDEADELAPQKPRPEATKLLGAMEDFVRRGRSRGLGCTLVTQRPAVLNKDVLTQVEVLITMQMTAPLDVNAITEWVKLNSTLEEFWEVKSTLSGLKAGEGWVWSPSWLDILQRVKFRARRTFDSSVTPKIGQVARTAERKPIDLGQLGDAIAATVEAQKQSDPKVLQARVAELTETNRRLEVAVEELRTEYLDKMEALEPERVEVPVVSDADREKIIELDGALYALAKVLPDYRELHRAMMLKFADVVGGIPAEPVHKTPSVRRELPSLDFVKPAGHDGPHHPVRVPAPAAPREPFEGVADQLGSMQRAILTVLKQRGPSTRKRIGAFAGKAHGGGAFTTAMGQLAKAGYTSADGVGRVHITPAGEQALGELEPLPTGQALIDSLLGKMSNMERAIFETLLDAYPNGLTRAEIGERSGKASGGGAFTTAMGKLTRVDLVMREGPLNYVSAEVGEAIRG